MSARILVIDDENNIRTMVQLALRKVGYAVETAVDGSEGLEKFADGAAWDLVLLDHRMPGMAGLDALREMRRRRPSARIVMITAFGTIDLAVDAMKAGATDFLRKPFTIEALRGAVAAALGGVPGPAPAVESPSPPTYALMTINGFHLESRPARVTQTGGEIAQEFTVRSPEGEAHPCRVLLPAYLVELIKAHIDRDEVPYGDRFWHALCEEALANYVWQQASLPPDGTLRVDEYTTGLRRWVAAVLSGGS